MQTKLIEIEESYRSHPYHCTQGFPTIGIGKKIGPKNADLELYQFSVSREIAGMFLNDELRMLNRQLTKKFTWFVNLSQTRKDIIISMCYQLGLVGFCKFKKTIAYIAAGEYRDASVEMLDSRWHKQTSERAMRHSVVMCSGDYESVDLYKNINEED